MTLCNELSAKDRIRNTTPKSEENFQGTLHIILKAGILNYPPSAVFRFFASQTDRPV